MVDRMKRRIKALVLSIGLIVGAVAAVVASPAAPVQAAGCISYVHGNGGIARCNTAPPFNQWKYVNVLITCVGWTTQVLAGPRVSVYYGQNSYRACNAGYSIARVELRLSN